jgi:peptidoglycan/LPS O-acetylase OafA/YrhL
LLGADFLRAAACLIVLFHHLALRLSTGEISPALQVFRTFAHNGTFGVAIFFVLSGFLLARPFWQALDKGQPMPSPGTYAMRRAARILPGFWLALTVTFVASIAIFGAPPDGALVLRYIAGLLLVADWHWLTFFPVEVNGPLWSISFEVTCYVLLPLGFALLFWCASRTGWRSRMLWLGVIALALLGQWLIVNHLPVDPVRRGWDSGLVDLASRWMPRYNPLGFFVMFAIGSLAAGLQVRWRKYRSLTFDVLALIGLGLTVSLFAANADAREASVFGWLDIPYDFPWLVLTTGLVLCAAPSSRYVGRVLDNPPSRYIARISFGIYVWHSLVIEIAQKYWSPDFRLFAMDDPIMFTATSVVITALSIIIAHLSYHFIERPIILWARGREKRVAEMATFSPAAG